MFPWNIAKSAEAMFSRWAIKRVCKFLLKKKLGKFILGDVDLNQLDVQLSAGTVQLSDLALNVDYLNQKFGAAAAVIVKEGSIGSLLLTLPWRGDGCRIEVDELELVIAPCGRIVSHDRLETCNSSPTTKYHADNKLGKLENDAASSGSVVLTSVDIHEGVKTIAKMVKWLLSSFHVRIKKLIVAFDPCVEEEANKRFSRSLVLRIAEIECGTCISEDAHLMDKAKDNFLGLSRLKNFIKFQGAVLEFLQMDNVEHQTPCACASGTTFGEWFSNCCRSTAMTPVVTGKNGGFSGHLKLSIPWKNGSLDIRKVDADAYIEPMELRFQPSTLISFIYLWGIFEEMGLRSGDQMLCKATESVCENAASNYASSMPGHCSLNAYTVLAENDSSVVNCSSLLEEERRPEALLSQSHLISDWVGRSQKDRTYVEPDFGERLVSCWFHFARLKHAQDKCLLFHQSRLSLLMF